MIKKILIVDDTPIVQQANAILVTALGYQVAVASDGFEALTMVKRGEFGGILMDLDMPIMDGFECAAKIREMEIGTGKRVPIICMTASSQTNIFQHCLDAGMDDYLSKDCSDEELDRVLQKFIVGVQ